MSAYTTAVAADTPLAWYRLGEPSGTSAADNSGNSHTGTYVNTPTLGATGLLLPDVDADTAVTFASASSQRVLLDTLGSLGSSAATLTAEFWIKTTTTSTLQAAFGTVKTGTSMICACYLNTDNTETASVGKTCFALRDNAGVLQRAHITTNIYDGVPHHVVWVVASATDFTIYVDGASVSKSISANTLGTMANFDFAMTIGARNLRGTLDRFADATLDEVAFYTTRLSAARVLAHYRAGRGRAGTGTGTISLSGVGFGGRGGVNLATTEIVTDQDRAQLSFASAPSTSVAAGSRRTSVVLDYG